MGKSAHASFNYLFQNSADSLRRSIFIVLGVAGQELQDPLTAVWQSSKHISEGATAVNGKVEFPFSLGHRKERESQAWNHKS